MSTGRLSSRRLSSSTEANCGRRTAARMGRFSSRTYGTADGTVLVKDIDPGTGGSYVDHLTNVNGTLYFTANDGTNGNELWKSDGTAGGTVLVKDVNLGPSGSYAGNLTNVNGTLYFSANDGVNGVELWKSDG